MSEQRKVCTMGVIIRMSGNHGRLFKKEMMDYRCVIIGAVFWRDFVDLYISIPSVTLSHGDNFQVYVLYN